MAEIFPSELQDKFNESAFSYKMGDTAINSSVQSGIPKRRQIYTQSVDEIGGTINLDVDDWSILETFYKVTLGGGVKTFNYEHPLTHVQSEFRFQAAPSLSPIGGKWFRVSFKWIEIE